MITQVSAGCRSVNFANVLLFVLVLSSSSSLWFLSSSFTCSREHAGQNDLLHARLKSHWTRLSVAQPDWRILFLLLSFIDQDAANDETRGGQKPDQSGVAPADLSLLDPLMDLS